MSAYVAEAVGEDSYAGHVSGIARSFRHPLSPLQRGMNRLLIAMVAIMIPLGGVLALALWLAVAPIVPEPHLIEKLRMLSQGTLTQPIDIFDLLLHTTPLVLLAVRRFTVSGEEADLRPASPAQTPHPAMDIGPDEGPVMVTVEYLIDPARAGEFAEVMRLTRQARLRQGALSWGLFRDTERPGRYVEYFVDETWVEHLRRQERFTADDVQLRGQRLAFHLGEAVPTVRRYVGAALEDGSK